MNYQIKGNPDQGHMVISLEPGERFYSQAGAMSYMGPTINITPQMIGGLMQGIFRKFAGGESLFLSEYSASARGGIALAPTLPGTVSMRELNGQSLMLTAGSYLAHTPGIQISTRFGGMRSLFSGEGAFLIEASGTGLLFFSSYGSVVEREVNGQLAVDTGHLVAFDPSLQYKISGSGGLKQTLLSGEGLLMRFEGHGKIYLQTRVLSGLVGWLSPFCRG